MDPGMLSVEDWQARLLALRLMWLCLILAFTAAGSLVIAHAGIPSAVESGTLSTEGSKFILALYLTGIFAFVLDVAVFLYALSLAQGIISDIYPSFWQ